MGILANTVKQLDNSAQQKTEISESLDLLVALTEAKAKEYQRLIEESLNRGRILGKGDSTDSLYYPISSVKDKRVEYRCITENTPTDLVSQIAGSIKGMIDDHTGKGIVDGVAGIINSAMQPLLGLSEGAEQYCSTTSTFIEGNGVAINIVRFDCIIWGRSIRAESIKKSIDKTLACVAYKSVVDVSRISFDEFRAVYAPILEVTKSQDILGELRKAREYYEILGGGSRLPKVMMAKGQADPAEIQEGTTGFKALKIDDLIAHSPVIMSEDQSF